MRHVKLHHWAERGKRSETCIQFNINLEILNLSDRQEVGFVKNLICGGHMNGHFTVKYIKALRNHITSEMEGCGYFSITLISI